MREFLDDAHAHRDDGYGRAQKLDRVELPKRFYKDVDVARTERGYVVTLDGRQTRTPTRVEITVPSLELAQLMATEWAAQGEHIDPVTMPVVRLVNAAVEGGSAALQPLRDEVLKYAGNDLLLYRADSPRELVAEQDKHWDAMLVTLARHFGVAFQPAIGVIHQPQAPATLERLAAALSSTNVLQATALVSITGLTGSGLMAIGLLEGLFDADAVWQAAHVDEDHNIRLWGEVEEATQRRQHRRTEYDAALKVLKLAKA